MCTTTQIFIIPCYTLLSTYTLHTVFFSFRVRRSRVQKKDKSSFISIQTEAVFIKTENILPDVEYETVENIPTLAELRSNNGISTDHKTECRSIENILNEAEYRSNENISTDVETEYRSNENRSVDDEAKDRSNENRLVDDEAEYRSNENILPVVELKIDESTQTEAEFVNNISRPVTLLDMLYKDEQVQAFTGLESIKAFRRLCDTFERLEPKTCPSHCRFKTKLEDRILLTLMKLKMNCSFPCLSAFFHTTTTSAATYFYQTLRMMHQFLKHLIPWPSREEVKKNLPKCFDRFPRVRVVLDYCEFPVECCGCGECSVRCLSPKKRIHTLKAEFGISPAGLITHVSPVYGGRASDKFILTKSGILDKLEVGDCILTIENALIRSECEEKGIKLIQPIFSSDEQFILKGPEDIYYIEQAKVHIQQSILRLKTFAVLSDKVSWSMAPYFDEIIGVICGITNLSAPVLADNKFKT